ncbi:MAG: hypothetical protein SGPRY_006684 [Prymnesium sp.]
MKRSETALEMLRVWVAAVLACGAWEAACGYTKYDLRLSSPSCTRLKGEEQCTHPPSPWCVDAPMVSVFSPRWLSNIAGLGGPLLAWAPLLVARPFAAPDALHLTALWYLSLIGFVRHSPLITPRGWDPSGHIFVYGAQLVPYWLVPIHQSESRARGQLAEHALFAWSSVLFYLSLTTASFFHTLSESTTGCFLVLCLYQLLLSRGLRREGVKPRQSIGVRGFSPVTGCVFVSWLVGNMIGWLVKEKKLPSPMHNRLC